MEQESAGSLGRPIVRLSPGGPDWPTQVDQLAEPPRQLFTIGRPIRQPLLRSVAIVGARQASGEGCATARAWAQELARLGYTVVSGGAFGIDAAAHEGALRGGGHTIAVLASGADVDSPRGNGRLLEAVRRHGSVVSEHPPGQPPARDRFLPRNRLIAALTPATLVVQAAHRSGALNTARSAAELHRIVMAVPGAVTDAAHVGCHELVREQVAILVTTPWQVAELLAPLTEAGSLPHCRAQE